MSQWFVYILRCADKTLYTGVTTDPERRLKKHNAGTASHYTRAKLPVKMAYQEKAKSRSMALRREAEIKKMRRTDKLKLIMRPSK